MTRQGNGQGRHSSVGSGRAGHDDDAEVRATASARTWLRLFLLALLCGVLTSSLMLPWKVLALVFSLFALASGVVALVKAIRLKLPRLVVLSTSLGLAAALFLAAGTAASVLLWPVTQTYEDCMSRALTLQAESECQDGLQRLDGLG
ncbi:hypothetical protein D6T63_07505 [Arthrobacter cheniae]|uniref:Uncharacterized protein n=1 Tax=Arthrobacter cheniae TaxID=1258888 RepID=A0A3A5MCY2_9MICC|nr:hypothetical protein [Arthrobacter cheniae]RJT81024.1 hypothetical protein D6T63_07505 [Arthrobacter cheniae]